MVLFMWTLWGTVWRPSAVLHVALKCLTVYPISKEPRPFRYSLSLPPSPRPSAARRLCHGNRSYVLSQRWVFWGNHGRRTTRKVNSSGWWECDADSLFFFSFILRAHDHWTSWFILFLPQSYMQWAAFLYYHPGTRLAPPTITNRDSVTYQQAGTVNQNLLCNYLPSPLTPVTLKWRIHVIIMWLNRFTSFVQEDILTVVKLLVVLVCCSTLHHCTLWTCCLHRRRYPQRTPQTDTASPQTKGETKTRTVAQTPGKKMIKKRCHKANEWTPTVDW